MAYDLSFCLETIYGRNLVFKDNSDKWKLYLDIYLDKLKYQRDQGLVPYAYDKPIGVQLELTHKCNLRCIQCYNDSGSRPHNQELDKQQWLSIAKQLGEMGIFECVISGGEPLICDYVFNVMDILNDYGVQFVFITNGRLLNIQNIKNLLKYKYNWIQVSVDGAKSATHDEIRGWKGSWEHAIIGVKKLCDLGFPVVTAFTAFKKNMSEVGGFIDLCGYMGVSRVVIGEMIPVGRAGLHLKDQILSADDVARMEQTIQEKRNRWSGIMEISIPLPIEIQVKMKALQPNGVLLIRPDGNVRIDCIIPFSVGNLFNESLQEVWKKAKLIQYSKSLHQYALEIESNRGILNSKFGVSYITKDYSITPKEISVV